jgi:hypothetical protein
MKTTVAPEGEMAARGDFLNTSVNFVSPEYFETMGIPFLAGRNFRPGEPLSKPQLVVVNRAFVRRFFPTVDPIGQKFGISAAKIAADDLSGPAAFPAVRRVVHPARADQESAGRRYPGGAAHAERDRSAVAVL